MVLDSIVINKIVVLCKASILHTNKKLKGTCISLFHLEIQKSFIQAFHVPTNT